MIFLKGKIYFFNERYLETLKILMTFLNPKFRPQAHHREFPFHLSPLPPSQLSLLLRKNLSKRKNVEDQRMKRKNTGIENVPSEHTERKSDLLSNRSKPELVPIQAISTIYTRCINLLAIIKNIPEIHK